MTAEKIARRFSLRRLKGIAASLRDAVVPARGGRVPARVAARIASYEAESERLITWAQLLGALVFFILWLATPATLRPGGYVDFTPYVLIFYASVVGLRLAMRFDGTGRPLVLALSIFLDIAVLLALIAALPLTLASPPADALKHSAAAFLFVIVALRGLRFQPLWALYAGGIAALGWSALGVWAAIADPSLVTGDVETYLNGSAILVAAEIDRVGALLAFSGILALIVARSGALVREASTGRAAQEELSRFFAPNVAASITNADVAAMPGAAVRRMATIVFFDLRGFSRLAETIEADALIALLGEYHRLVVPIIRRHAGSVDKFLGDGILVSFGATAPSATHARDALLALGEVFAAAAVWSGERRAAGHAPLAIGGAASSGEVVYGIIGYKDRLEITVIGDCVNVAAKLEKHTKTEGVSGLASRATYTLARDQGYADALEERAARAVSGLGQPVDLVVVRPRT